MMYDKIEFEPCWNRLQKVDYSLPALNSMPCEYWYDDYYTRCDRYDATRLFASYIFPNLIKMIIGRIDDNNQNELFAR